MRNGPKFESGMLALTMVVGAGLRTCAGPTLRASCQSDVRITKLRSAMVQDAGEWELLRQALHEMVDSMADEWLVKYGHQGVVWERTID